MPWQRLQSDFRFALISLFGALGVLCVLPIAIFRLVTGDTTAGIVDLTVVVAVVVGVVHMWRGGSVEVAGRIAGGMSALGVIAASKLVGLPGLLWVYPIVVACFLLVDKRWAIGYGVAAVAGVTLVGEGFGTVYLRIAFALTALMVALFAYIFARRTEEQRLAVEQLATRDALTSAANRRAMERDLPIAVSHSRRMGIPIGLAVLDVDHFKRINDSLGHEAGDRVLVELAHLVARSCRQGDRLFRYGGEEFVLMLPGVDEPSLKRVCEALRVSIATHITVDGRPVTVSIGAAVLEPDLEVAGWLAAADAALYRAKREGRNRVVMAASREDDATGCAEPESECTRVG